MPRPSSDQRWHDAHAAVLQAIAAKPGLGVREMSRWTGFTVQTVRAHLAPLIESGDVEAWRDFSGRHRHHLPGVALQPNPLPADQQRVLDFIAANPGASQQPSSRRSPKPRAARRSIVWQGSFRKVISGKPDGTTE